MTVKLQKRFDEIRADYDATRQSRYIRRRTGVHPQGSSPDYHFRTEIKYYELIEQARDMDRNDGLVSTLADRRVDNIVQQGFALDTKTGDKGLDLDLWNRWQAFASDAELCDIAGESNFHEMERAICRAESIDGDIVAVGTEDGPLQLIEAHAIQTGTKVENTFLGVTRNQYGRRETYYVRYDTDEFGGKSEAEPLAVRNDDGVRQLFHVYNPKRVNMTRGVTQLAPVFSLSGMLEDINFAKLVQQQIVSCFAILRNKPSGRENLPSVDGVSRYGEQSTETTTSGTKLVEGIQPGMEVEGNPGETLTMDSPNVPNSEYFQQVKLILQIIGVNFGLPLCLVLMDGSETNFSGWRGAVDEARKGFVADQVNLVNRFHSPVYRWWLYREIQTDRTLAKIHDKMGDAIYGHKWNMPTWSYIEPVADAEGDLTQLRGALTSRRRLHASRGSDWEEIVDETVEDNSYAISRAMTKADEINGANPGQPQVNWRDLMPMPVADGATMSMQDPGIVQAQQESARATDPEPSKDNGEAPAKAVARRKKTKVAT